MHPRCVPALSLTNFVQRVFRQNSRPPSFASRSHAISLPLTNKLPPPATKASTFRCSVSSNVRSSVDSFPRIQTAVLYLVRSTAPLMTASLLRAVDVRAGCGRFDRGCDLDHVVARIDFSRPHAVDRVAGFAVRLFDRHRAIDAIEAVHDQHVLRTAGGQHGDDFGRWRFAAFVHSGDFEVVDRFRIETSERS